MFWSSPTPETHLLYTALVLPSSTLIADEVFIFTTGSDIKLQFIEHSVWLIDYNHGEDQPGLLNQEHPTAIKNRVHKKVHEKTKQFLWRMWWKSYYFLNQQETSTKDTYGFKSKHSLHKINELIPFEGMLNLIQNIKFKDSMKSSFQWKLDADTKNKIKNQTASWSLLTKRQIITKWIQPPTAS